MSRSLLPAWMFIGVAFAIAMTGLALAQMTNHGGMVFVLAATTIWVSYVQARHRKMMK